MKKFKPRKFILIVAVIAAMVLFFNNTALGFNIGGFGSTGGTGDTSGSTADTGGTGDLGIFGNIGNFGNIGGGLGNINISNLASPDASSDDSGSNASNLSAPTAETSADTARKTGTVLALATNVASAVITLIAGLINVAINFGKEVIGLDIVKVGSQTVLGFANLGFVLAIIIIAFATIFRVQSYAIKQTLWKLIVAALLVNFSLVIAGAFISVADTFINLFLPGDSSDLATGLTGVLQPQKLAEVKEPSKGFLNLKVFDLSYWFKYAASLFFVLVFTMLSIFVLAALFIMLLIRAIYLAILLIIMPIVWLLWIFPSTVRLWRQWWNNFLRWTFFAPITLFFMYLIVATGKGITNLQSLKGVGGEQTISQAFEGGLMLEAAGGGEPGFFAHVAQLLVICGLLIGGLIAANKLSISGAKQSLNLAQSGGKMFGGWVGRKVGRGALKYGTGWARAKGAEEGGKSLAEKTQEWAATRKTPIGKWGAGLITRGTAKLAALGGENLVNKAKKELEGKSSLELKNVAATTMDTPTKIAATEKLKEMKELGSQDMTRLLTVEQKAKFKSFGKENVFDDIQKSVGASVEMMSAAMKKDVAALSAATEEFSKKLKLEDVKKMHVNDIYSGKAKFGLNEESTKLMAQSLTAGLAKNLPNAFIKIRPQLKGENQKVFKTIVKGQLDMMRKAGIEEDKKMADSIERSLERNMGELTMDFGEAGAKS